MSFLTLVCGFGRCGSSMVAQMFYHGGMKVAGVWPDFEPIERFGSVLDGKEKPKDLFGDWLDNVEVLKLLEPADNPIREGRYKVIWLDRNIDEQAKSYGKLRRMHMNKPANRKAIGIMRRHMRKNRERQLRVANRLSMCPPMMLRFEDVLADPLATAHKLAEFVERDDLNIARMAAGVLKRGPECQKEFIESKLMRMRLV